MKRHLSWPGVSGPLAPYARRFRTELLEGLGYSAPVASKHMYLMAHLSRWLGERGLAPSGLDAAAVSEFLADRRAAGHVTRLTRRGLDPLLDFLADAGVVGETLVAPPADPCERLMTEFATHLEAVRGLRPATIVGYVRSARLFLCACAPDLGEEGCGVARLGLAEINAFLLAEGARRGIGDARNLVTALRALLGYFYVSGRTPTCLTDCIPSGAAWRDSGRSKAVATEDVRRLLTSCDRRRAKGRRDLAILTVLWRLGLRSGEVAALDVDDLDWRAGEIVVVGKGRRRDCLPLPADVGQAIADYCQRGRPRTDERALFLHVRAPYGRLSSSAVSQVVLEASRRAGLGAIRAHRLRHTSASAMRQAGAPLFEIGQVLRHRWTGTTALYAKDDVAALAAIARPWPGAAK